MGLVSGGFVKGLVNKYLSDTSVTVALIYKGISNSYNSSTAENTETATSISMRGIRIVYTKESALKTISDRQMAAGDVQGRTITFLIREKYFSDNSITPKKGDKITYDSIDFEISDFEKVNVGSTEIMYEFNCTKS